jgi:hypothetical protein
MVVNAWSPSLRDRYQAILQRAVPNGNIWTQHKGLQNLLLGRQYEDEIGAAFNTHANV